MAKLAQKGERTFSPIADKLIEAVSAPEVLSTGPTEESPPERKVVPMRREEEGNTHQAPPTRRLSPSLLSGSAFLW
jgi:hypothetical protein